MSDMNKKGAAFKTGNTILAIATAISVVCIIIGCANRFNWGGFRFSLKHEEPVSGDYSVGAINDLECDISCSKIVIQKGAKNTITYNVDSSALIPEITEKDGVLTIEQSDKIDLSSGLGFGNNDVASEIVITVADELATANIVADMGDVNVEGITADVLTFTCDMGNLDIKDCHGDIIKLECDMSNVDIDDSSCKTLTATCDMGNISVTDTAFSSLTGECDMGNIDIDVVEDIENYSISADCDMGDVKIDGKKYEGGYNKTGGKNTIKLECSMGTVNIK